MHRLNTSGLSWDVFSARAVEAMSEAVPADVWCVATADPATLMMTGITGSHIDDDASRFFELEYGADDFLLQADLARAAPHVGALNLATHGRPQRSVRWRELFEPFGLGDQLRGALVSPTGCWGFFSLARAAGEKNFSASEVASIASLLRTFADGLRLAVVGDKARAPIVPTDPVLLVLDGDLAVVEVSEAAENVFERSIQIGSPPPMEVLAPATRAKLATEGYGRGPFVTTSIRRSGKWLRTQAVPLGSGATSRIAIIVEHARPDEVAELMLQANGLTRREAEVTRRVLMGLSTDEIARRLGLSPLTVQQHLKSVFSKMDVASRRELIAGLFFPNLKG
jgi:DNA-binding CsgD family transcriptional regulator